MNESIYESAKKIYTTLGCGHSESTYQNALIYELRKNENILCVIDEITFPIIYEGIPVGFQRADIIIQMKNGENIIIELKAINTIQPSVFNQVRRYLNQFNLFVLSYGIIINFSQDSVDFQIVPRLS